ncbi:DUF3289 family protein [Erwinia sp. AnSW2-5]|uniref:DUF3289 family protein n=1 Tax=Erwinia sp. AnSW2-5 TaxID=3367692 RepID=UPI00385C6FD6
MSALSFPCIIFTTKKRMDDFGAKDMCCGDLSAEQLKKDFGLSTVSDRVDSLDAGTKKAPASAHLSCILIHLEGGVY